MRAAHAEGVALLERAALADLAEPADVGDEDVDRLRHLVAQRRVAQVRAGHAVVHPAARLGVALRDAGVDVLGHVGEERDDVVVGDGLELVDALDLERGGRADVRGLLGGDARLPQLGLRLAREDLDLLPDLELVLELPDAGHLGTGVARDHGEAFQRGGGCPPIIAECGARVTPTTGRLASTGPRHRLLGDHARRVQAAPSTYYFTLM